MSIGKVSAFVVAIVRIGLVLLLWLIILQTYDRIVSARPQESLATLLYMFITAGASSVIIAYGLHRLRMYILGRSGDLPDLAMWRARWTDAWLSPLVFACLFLLSVLSAALSVISLGLALFYSYRTREALRCPPYFSRLLSATVAGHIVLVIGACEVLQSKISPGMLVCTACLSGWVFSIGLLQWHRPIDDIEVF